ncbi:uncharacterized protein LOC122036094 [Zingiber officinale]|uniref:uncharacterized protein LOC122036094 n=1 Tax=Zingiber officinale TaxID=94328 RepID=UPI001C4B4AE6|nr:uncharacterized protein LOC122036094 [Zingiber officinale]
MEKLSKQPSSTILFATWNWNLSMANLVESARSSMSQRSLFWEVVSDSFSQAMEKGWLRWSYSRRMLRLERRLSNRRSAKELLLGGNFPSHSTKPWKRLAEIELFLDIVCFVCCGSWDGDPRALAICPETARSIAP